MKIYITTDIEGIAGTTVWEETAMDKPDYAEFRQQMTAEVAAACRGALKGGATDVLVKDSHGRGRNIFARQLPVPTRLVRGSGDHPYSMAGEMDKSFDAMMMVGYHAFAGSDGNPLAHTLSGRMREVKVNGRVMSEFCLCAYTAGMLGVPVAFVSGDQALCDHARTLVPGVTAIAVKRGSGADTISLHPEVAAQQIEEAAARAISGDLSKCVVKLPKRFVLEVSYREHALARKAGFYPGIKQTGPHSVVMKTDNWYDVLRAAVFVM